MPQWINNAFKFEHPAPRNGAQKLAADGCGTISNSHVNPQPLPPPPPRALHVPCIIRIQIDLNLIQIFCLQRIIVRIIAVISVNAPTYRPLPDISHINYLESTEMYNRSQPKIKWIQLQWILNGAGQRWAMGDGHEMAFIDQDE